MRPHLSLNVKNLGKSVEFYSMVFGVKPQKYTEDYAKFDLQDPKFNFSMHEVSDDRLASRVNHLGIEVSDLKYVHEWQERFERLKISTLPEENTNCCYARQDKFWFQDPDGNSWEIFFVHEQLPTIGAEPPKIKLEGACATSSGGCC